LASRRSFTSDSIALRVVLSMARGGKVEAEALRLHQRSLLPNVRTQPLPEDVVHQVRGAVIALDIVTSGRIDRGMQ
jgi:hypothetical protein